MNYFVHAGCWLARFWLIVLCAAPMQAAQAAPVGQGALPQSARIRYSYGPFPVELHWRTADGAYRLDLALTVLHKAIAYRSEGRLTAQGLQPQRFAEYRDHAAEPRYLAEFDWPKGTLTLGKLAERRQEVLQPGDQDLFSAAFQLAQSGGRAVPGALINGRKRYAGAVFAAPQRSRLQLGRQEIDVIVLHGRMGERTVDYWLAPRWGNLPVRMALSLPDGSYDLWANEVELDGKIVWRAEPSRKNQLPESAPSGRE
ncbi:DUF3108 domain-containing protein [Chitinilyticum litopenaei]|uniref:DUF3108 domain-containing protein n=1 Tax=Chitinilyticum litopenaei TaxID=1121276 RepID=UPI0003F511AC|nr:DUF3108 domain-containing protein [Chitinilyticum litopenaei]